ncbi:MAG: hypothetical protein IJR85_06675 [Synergistaceae bacterium]|nr:hypothetical protein [Synergistaceae bacterium]
MSLYALAKGEDNSSYWYGGDGTATAVYDWGNTIVVTWPLDEGEIATITMTKADDCTILLKLSNNFIEEIVDEIQFDAEAENKAADEVKLADLNGESRSHWQQNGINRTLKVTLDWADSIARGNYCSCWVTIYSGAQEDYAETITPFTFTPLPPIHFALGKKRIAVSRQAQVYAFTILSEGNWTTTPHCGAVSTRQAAVLRTGTTRSR